MGRSIPIVLENRTFKSKSAASEYFGAMLATYQPGERVNQGDDVELRSLLARHPEASSKVGIGVDHFEIQAADFGSQCFRVVRTDGTWERFSYHSCVEGHDVHA